MPYEGLGDPELVRRSLAGDERAFSALVGRYLRPALAVAWEFTETREDAEDIVQDTFRRVVSALDRFDSGRPFRPWFFTILRNAARNAAGARSLRTHEELRDDVPIDDPSPLDELELAELRGQVDVELDSLSDMQRACFRLCVLEGLTSGEVADALDLSDATVRTHVLRARTALRAALQPFTEEPRSDDSAK